MEFKEIDWHGYRGFEFEFEGLSAYVIMPEGKPCGSWILKTEYFNAFPATDLELLSRGWCIAFNENFDRWAQERDLLRKVRFAEFVSMHFGLSQAFVLEGMSCGGLFAVKLASMIPEKIEGLYLDAPVMNLLSCPFGIGRESASSEMIEEYISATGMNLSDVMAYREHPIDLMHILAEHGIPVVLVAGDSDTVVPYRDNGRHLEELYRKSGLDITVYIKEGCGHHPHGLPDPKMLADAIVKMTL